MTAPMLPATSVVASTQQVSTTLSSEAVILHVANGVYFGLNQVGARFWELVQQPVTLQQVANAIVAEYDVDDATATADVARLAAELHAKGLLDVVAAPAS